VANKKKVILRGRAPRRKEKIDKLVSISFWVSTKIRWKNEGGDRGKSEGTKEEVAHAVMHGASRARNWCRDIAGTKTLDPVRKGKMHTTHATGAGDHR